uniref:Uncharacterized protein n=1 Tax=Kalanchoe fedtschenkoi TaxID=63787 RepID=A0A7N0TVI4_KALFE
MFLRSVEVSILVFLAVVSSSSALVASLGNNPRYPKALSDLKEVITQGLGFQADDVKISGFDIRDVLVGHSVAYEFDVEIGNKVTPLKLLEDVSRWEYVDLPIFRMEDPRGSGKELALRSKVDDGQPVLEPFQLAGPMELWIQDAKDIRISLPDVDAGVLKKVILAEGAVVTVKGARSVSLRHPVELPLPLNRTGKGFASGILSLAERLRQASLIEGATLLSLRIVGPVDRLRLKRLAPGLVELSSPSKPKSTDGLLSAVNLEDATALLTPMQFTTMWPLASVNASNSNLLGFEALLSSLLGPKASKSGSFKLLRADVD